MHFLAMTPKEFLDFVQIVGSVAGLLAIIASGAAGWTAIIKANYGRQQQFNRLFEQQRQLSADMASLKKTLDINTATTNKIAAEINEIALTLRIRGPRSQEFKD